MERARSILGSTKGLLPWQSCPLEEQEEGQDQVGRWSKSALTAGLVRALRHDQTLRQVFVLRVGEPGVEALTASVYRLAMRVASLERQQAEMASRLRAVLALPSPTDTVSPNPVAEWFEAHPEDRKTFAAKCIALHPSQGVVESANTERVNDFETATSGI